MIHFPGRIPITIHLTFWIFAALIGYWIGGNLAQMFIWIGIIFVSVLFHEMGHAVTALIFGQHPRIELVALGGLTYHDGQKLPLWKQFFIVLDGPLCGFILFGVAALALQLSFFSQGIPARIMTLLRDVNLFWTIINLLPVMPLDGGQLLRIVLEKIFGIKGFRYAICASLVLSLIVALLAFLMQSFLIGALFFLFAFQSYDMLRKTRHLSETDRDGTLQQSLEKAEESIQLGKKEQASALCEEVRQKAKKGMIFDTATQYLALLKYEEGKLGEAYALLLSIREDLNPDALCLLQKIAFEQRDFSLVTELAGACFQTWPTSETALRNACAHAQLKQALPSVGWLRTAIDEGLPNRIQILSDALFDPIREDPAFQSLLKEQSH